MKIKEGFELRNVCGENIIIAHGVENIDFTKVITLNESAAMLWTAVQKRDFEESELVDMMLKEYDVDSQTAQADVKALINSWIEAGLVEK